MALLAILLLLALDQLSKTVVLGTFALGETRWVYTDVAGFGISAYLNPLNAVGAPLPPEAFVAIGVAAAAVGVVLAFRPGPRLQRVCGVFAAAGALGNSVDRLKHGAVVDWIGPGWIGPVDIPIVCNLADLFIVGSLLILLRSWRPQLRISDPQ